MVSEARPVVEDSIRLGVWTRRRFRGGDVAALRFTSAESQARQRIAECGQGPWRYCQGTCERAWTGMLRSSDRRGSNQRRYVSRGWSCLDCGRLVRVFASNRVIKGTGVSGTRADAAFQDQVERFEYRHLSGRSLSDSQKGWACTCWQHPGNGGLRPWHDPFCEAAVDDFRIKIGSNIELNHAGSSLEWIAPGVQGKHAVCLSPPGLLEFVC